MESNEHSGRANGFETSPALRFRSKSYPPLFAGRVPRRIKMVITVRPDFPASGRPAVAGDCYEAWTNSHGAVAAVLPDGNLGVKPSEFEVTEWVNPESLPPPRRPGG